MRAGLVAVAQAVGIDLVPGSEYRPGRSGFPKEEVYMPRSWSGALMLLAVAPVWLFAAGPPRSSRSGEFEASRTCVDGLSFGVCGVKPIELWPLSERTWLLLETVS